MPCCTIAEFVEYAVSIALLHLCMNIVAGIAKFGNFLGEQLNAIDRVAKNNRLVDFKFRE